MVLPVIVGLGLLFLVAVYFAVTYWYITLPIIALVAILVRHSRIKNKKREEEKAAAERRRQKFWEERRQRESEQERRQREKREQKSYEDFRNAFEDLFDSLFASYMRSIGKHYQVLGLEPDATYDQVKKRFRELSLKYHPDRNKSPDAEKKFKQIYKAFTVIKNRMEKNRRYEKSQTH